MISAGNKLNSSPKLWWSAPIVFIFQYFWWVFALIIVFYFPILRIWWWFFFPIILYFFLYEIYLYWLQWDIWYKKFKWIVLEITPPKQNLRPFKAMEDIYETLWAIIDVPKWREIYCEGELPLGGGTWLSFEVACFGGKEIHFYARMPDFYKNTFETALYAHYPELEIKEVPDYTNNIPKDIPNEKYDVRGEDFCFLKEHCYPIKTWSAFFEEKPEVREIEVKRIDPINSMLEQMASVGPSEQFWMQIVLNPIVDCSTHNRFIPWISEGKKIAAKIARRKEEKKESALLKEIKKMFVPPSPAEIFPPEKGTVLPTEEEKIEGISPARTETGEREMIITPRERAVLSAIEGKMSKYAFSTWIRAVYICQRDKPHNERNVRITRTYMLHFKTADLNAFKFWDQTRTRIHYFFRNRRLYLRKRKLVRNFVQRFPPFWPRMEAGEGTPVLNTEELATIFHFPTEIILPAVPRIEAKPGGPPPGLPVE